MPTPYRMLDSAYSFDMQPSCVIESLCTPTREHLKHASGHIICLLLRRCQPLIKVRACPAILSSGRVRVSWSMQAIESENAEPCMQCDFVAARIRRTTVPCGRGEGDEQAVRIPGTRSSDRRGFLCHCAARIRRTASPLAGGRGYGQLKRHSACMVFWSAWCAWPHGFSVGRICMPCVAGALA